MIVAIQVTQKANSMTNQIFVWKQLTSPADLPKEEGEYTVKNGFGEQVIRLYKPKDADTLWLQCYTAYLCPLTVDNIPEWVSQEAEKFITDVGVSSASVDPRRDREIRKGFRACASLLIPLINQGKGGDK